MSKLVSFSLFLCLLVGCKQSPNTVYPSFYHWQTALAIDSVEQAYLRGLEAKRLYVKFFDVKWDEGRNEATPHAILQPQAWPQEVAIVPTVFITNRSMRELNPPAIAELADRLLEKVGELLPAEVPWPELQIDCDWTKSTRANYFELLRQIREQLPEGVQLSATIRLHQYRYPDQTGVPPVDRGMLMFYNMGDIGRWEEPNSILNLETAALYLDEQKYDLPLDLALPLFRWGVLFRDRQLIKLINGLESTTLQDTSLFREVQKGRFEVVKSTYLEGYYLYRGDELRLEGVSTSALREAAQLLLKVPAEKKRYLAFYHLDRPVLESYTYAELEKVLELLAE